MTPRDLLEDVKARFPLLLVQDPGQLDRLLRQALLIYQEKAGHVVALRVKGDNLDLSAPAIATPKNSLSPIGGEDSRGVAVFLTEVEQPGGAVEWGLALSPYHLPPYILRYFFDFTGMDREADHLPRGTAGMIGDYLYALIDIVNTQRQRQVNQSSEIPFDHLRSDAELHQAKAEAEQAMAEEHAIIPSIVAA